MTPRSITLAAPQGHSLAEPMTEPEARRVTERIRTALDRVSTAWQDLAERVTDAYQRRADLALGYASWAEYAKAEFDVPTLATEVRRELVGLLSAKGMSTRAIAPVAGVSQKTVVTDMQVIPEVSPAPEPGSHLHRAPWPVREDSPEHIDHSPGEVLPTDRPGGEAPAPSTVVEQRDHDEAPSPAPRPVTGLDGKTYSRPELKPQEGSRRRPWPEAADDAASRLDKVVTTIKGLARDDRFATKYRNEAPPRFRKSLAEAIDALQRIHDQLTKES